MATPRNRLMVVVPRRNLAASVREDIARFAEEAMSPMMLKSAFHLAESERKYRNPEGRARRRTP